MTLLGKFAAALALIGSLSLPLSASALIPIGGKVVGIFPCKAGGYMYTVAGFGIGSGAFWYLPGTATFLYGPPIVGKWVIGLAAPSGGCGLPTVLEGTSPAI